MNSAERASIFVELRVSLDGPTLDRYVDTIREAVDSLISSQFAGIPTPCNRGKPQGLVMDWQFCSETIAAGRHSDGYELTSHRSERTCPLHEGRPDSKETWTGNRSGDSFINDLAEAQRLDDYGDEGSPMDLRPRSDWL